MTEGTGFDLLDHPLFRARCRRATPNVQRACAALLHEGETREAVEAFELEEQLLMLIRSALTVGPATKPSARTRQLIRRTKEFLELEFSTSLRLNDVADAVEG
jgi:hypothetical protein